MFGFLTNRLHTTGSADKARPGWFDRHCSPILLSIAKKACTHPIHTIVTIAFLASYSYLGVLQTGMLERTANAPGRVDFETLLAGSKRLRVGEETSWKWEVEEPQTGVQQRKVWLHPHHHGMASANMHRQPRSLL
jgi:hydroxymethylglutaryl-CoA reductase (NADPH)